MIKDISERIKTLLLFESPYIKTPFHDSIKVIFVDFTASGRPSPIVENYISTKILPYYSNTHSNAYCGILMKNLINETKDYIRKSLNIDKTKKIIFTGSGTTCAINHLIYCLKLQHNSHVNIFITALEHHSNYLPWVELAKKYKNISLNIIPIDNNFNLDLKYLENQINSTNNDVINVVSVIACSNVLGIRNDIKYIYQLLQKYNNSDCCYGKRNLLFVDYACNAPYDQINGNDSDVLFFSPHKFLGGVNTPGVLIANKELFRNKSPFIPGGGCVKKVCKNIIEYENDIEKRESSGTPNVIGIIKIKKIMELKNLFIDLIEHNEYIISLYVFKAFNTMKNKYDNLTVILPEYGEKRRLPIICFAINGAHYNFIVCLLNDLYGIQTRGGVSCTGILAEIIKDRYGITGWCRLTFNWLMNKEEIDYILDAVEFVIVNWAKYIENYKYDKKNNLYIYK